MAVQKLSLLGLSGGINALDTALYICMNDRYIHIEDTKETLRNITSSIKWAAEPNPYTDLLAAMTAMAKNTGIQPEDHLKTYRVIDDYAVTSGGKDRNRTEMLISDALSLDIDALRNEVAGTGGGIKALEEKIEASRTRVNENNRILDQVRHIANVDINIGDLFRFEFFKVRFGHLPRESYEALHLYAKEIDDVFFIASSFEKNEVWGLYVTPKSRSVRIDSLFSALHFERVRISGRASGTPDEIFAALNAETEELERSIGETVKALEARRAEALKLIEEHYEKLFMLEKIAGLRDKAARTDTQFTLTVWTPASHAAAASKQFESVGVSVSPVTGTPGTGNVHADIEPPTLLRNIPIFTPFEQIVTMYGTPSYNEADPTPLVAVTYALFYGIMFADMGQGLILLLGGLLLWRLKGMGLGKIAMALGVTSMSFGFVFGSLFGLEGVIPWYRGYHPLEHINTILLAAVGLGIATVTAAILLNIANGIRQRSVHKAVFSQNGAAGLIFYWSVLIAALIMMGMIPLKVSAAVFIALALLCVVIVYLREPLTHICERKKEILPAKKGEFFIGNFFEVFEIVLSFVTNTISFIRIGAFALSHVGMMSVVLLLAGEPHNPVVMVIGNIFVTVLEGMLVAIQVLRLEFYEIFSRFFEGKGRKFESSGLK